MAVNDVFELRVLSNVLGVYCLNVFHYVVLSDPHDFWNKVTVNGQVGLIMSGNLANLMVDTATIRGWQTELIGSVTPPFTHRGFDNGFNTGHTTFARECLSFKIVAKDWRQRPGFKHVSGFPVQYSVDGSIISPFLGGCVSFANSLTQHFHNLSSDLAPCLWTRANIHFPLGKYTLLKECLFTGLSSQNSRTGRADDNLKAQFGIP